MHPIYALVLLINFGLGGEIQPFSFEVGKHYQSRTACNVVLKKRLRAARRGIHGHQPIGGACVVMKRR